MAPGVPGGHVTGDVTLPQKVKVMSLMVSICLCLGPINSKMSEDIRSFMTSRDLMSRSSRCYLDKEI